MFKVIVTLEVIVIVIHVVILIFKVIIRNSNILYCIVTDPGLTCTVFHVHVHVLLI